MPRPLILLILAVVCFGGGFGLGEISQMTSKMRTQGTVNDQQAVIFAAGQFTIPMFEDDRVPYFLLAEINLQLQTYDEVSMLSSNRPQVRATVLETLFELERRGDIKPGSIKPDVIQKAIKEDLETTFELDAVTGVLLNRLLVQETGGSRRQSSPVAE